MVLATLPDMHLFVVLLTVFVSFFVAPSSGSNREAEEYDLRLRDGNAEYEGRLEIYYRGHWGTICALGWSDHEGNVACRQLGFYGVFEVLDAKGFGEGNGPILLENVMCTTDDAKLSDCYHSQWYVHECNRNDVVGLRCLVNPPPDSLHEIRLVGGNSIFEGRIEIYYNGLWGTVCSDGWNFDDATVICRQLQFGPPKSASHYFGAGDGDILISSVSCFGYEKRIFDCMTTNTIMFTYPCSHDNDVGVMCNEPSDLFPLSITHSSNSYGTSSFNGQLNLYYHGRFGTICPHAWDTHDAEVACHQLGYGEPHQFGGKMHKPPIRSHAHPVLRDVHCEGDEAFLASCSHSAMGKGHCEEEDVVNIACSEADIQDYNQRLRLTGGNSNYEGLLEMFYQGKWGSICGSHTWGIEEANVACRTIGVGPAVATTAEYTVSSPGQFVARGVSCTGDEARLSDCQFTDLGVTSCDRYIAVSLQCRPFMEPIIEKEDSLRLVAGSVPYEGRLEWYLNGTWHTICSNGWDLHDAMVACRQLGYGVALEATTVFKKGRNTPKIVDHMNCSGEETTLLNCQHGPWGKCDKLTFYGDAGVVCNPVDQHQSSGSLGNYPLRLTGGTGPNNGRLEIQVGGTWGTIAASSLYNWTLTNAHVACHQLGYAKADNVTWHTESSGRSGPIQLTDVVCRGNEGAIAICSHSRYGVTDPQLNHSNDIYIACNEKIDVTTTLSTFGPMSTTSPTVSSTVRVRHRMPPKTTIAVVVVCVAAVLGIIVGGAILFYKRSRSRNDYPLLHNEAVKL